MTYLNGNNPASTLLRQDRAVIRAGLSSGTLTLADVLTDPPACIGSLMLFTVLPWRRGWGRDGLRKIGAAAIRDNVNLAVCVEASSVRTREWLIGHDRGMGRYAA